MKKHFVLILIFLYLYLCVTFPCRLNIDETSCLVGSNSIVYSIRNYSLLPFTGIADVSLQKLNNYGGWDKTDNPQLIMDVGYTVGITEKVKRNFTIKEMNNTVFYSLRRS